MSKKVAASDITVGMFVSELDRPWLDTPFLLQGFLIESYDQVQELRRYCKYVFIDPARSTGAAYEAPVKLDVQPEKSQSDEPRVVIRHVKAPKDAPHNPLPKGSILGDLKAVVKETIAGAAKPAPAPKRHAPTDSFAGPVIITSRAAGDQDGGTKSPPDLGREPPATVRRGFALRSSTHAPLVQGGPVITVGPRKGSVVQRVRDLMRAPDHVPPEPPKPREALRSYGDIEIVIYEDQDSAENEMERAKTAHDKTQEILDAIAADVRKDIALDVELVHEAVGGMVESMVRNPGAMLWLNRLKQRDSSVYGNALDVSVYLIAFGRHLGFPREQLNILGVSGLLLDVGKVKLPPELLTKKGILTKEEFEILRSHVDYSTRIVSETPNMPLDVIDAVATHHERQDGSGYPNGLKGAEIGMLGAMAGIVDTFQAMTSTRPYAPAVAPHQAMQDLFSWRDKLFHSALVEQFIQCLGIFPAGSMVELNTGEVAVVVTQNRVRKLKPKLLVILDPDKQPYPNPAMLDLIGDPFAFGTTPYQIVRSLSPGTYGIDPKQFYI